MDIKKELEFELKTTIKEEYVFDEDDHQDNSDTTYFDDHPIDIKFEVPVTQEENIDNSHYPEDVLQKSIKEEVIQDEKYDIKNMEQSSNFHDDSKKFRPADSNSDELPMTLSHVKKEILISEVVAVINLINGVFHERNFVCNGCSAIFPSVQLLKKHTALHNKSKLSYKSKFSKLDIEAQKTFKCDECDFKSTRLYNLNRHKTKHCFEKPFNCDECSLAFASIVNLKMHKRSHTPEKAFKCDQCDCKYKLLFSLKRHKKLHADERPFKCGQCNFKTTLACYLKKHLMSHTGEKPFKCDQCDFRTAHSSHLKTHKMGHSGEKPFVCDQCNYKTARAYDLKIHKILHTGEKPYKCDQCDFKCAQLSNLKLHQIRHRTNKKNQIKI